MAGEADQVTPVTENVPQLAELNNLSSEMIILYPAGHNLMLEMGDAVNSVLEAFVYKCNTEI
jgi:pimeloyl-ACP methyl ester carboxylesterase